MKIESVITQTDIKDGIFALLKHLTSKGRVNAKTVATDAKEWIITDFDNFLKGNPHT